MTAQAAEQPQRDAITAHGDYTLDMATTAVFFAQAILYGIPEAMTLAQVQKMAERFLKSSVPVYRHWNGKEVSGPEHEAEGARQ